MRKTRSPLISLFVTAALVATSGLAAERALSSEVQIAPMDKPGAYLATVELRDAASGELLSAPQVAFLQGTPARTQTTLDSGEQVQFMVEVDADGSSASYTAEVSVEGRVVARQKATVALGG